MYYVAEKNERRSRKQALVLAVTLHLALGALLYLQTSDKPNISTDTTTKVSTMKTKTLPQARP